MKVGKGWVNTRGGASQRSVLGNLKNLMPQAEELGYDFFSTNETKHNPFISAALACQSSEKIEIRTSIALAFARSPMDTAYMSWDLQELSGGRFQLGLGSQVRGHIVRRFNMPWGKPASRMKEYISALRAIWESWQNEQVVNFQGEFYNFNLMPPFFHPGPIENPNIKIYLAAVNSRMQQVAGELCDGVLLHTFNTAKHTQEVVMPNLQKGALKSGRSLEDIDIVGGGFIVTGSTEEEISANIENVRSSIAFYASTRSYAPVMNTHGWNDTAQKLYRMSVNGEWGDMSAEISDDMVEAFAVIGGHDEIVRKIKARYGTFASSVAFSIPTESQADKEKLSFMLDELKKD